MPGYGDLTPTSRFGYCICSVLPKGAIDDLIERFPRCINGLRPKGLYLHGDVS